MIQGKVLKQHSLNLAHYTISAIRELLTYQHNFNSIWGNKDALLLLLLLLLLGVATYIIPYFMDILQGANTAVVVKRASWGIRWNHRLQVRNVGIHGVRRDTAIIIVNVVAAVVLNGSSVGNLFPLRLVHIADILDEYVR